MRHNSVYPFITLSSLSLARSNSGSYLGSGDTGAEQHSVLVWSVLSRRPVLRLASPHVSGGVLGLQFSAEDRWLITVGGSTSHQSLCVWDWKDSPESPVSCLPLKSGKVFSVIACHPSNPNQFLVSSKTTVTFFCLDPVTSELQSHNPGSVEKEFGKSCGQLTQSVFLRNSRQVFSATTRGNIVVWLPASPSQSNSIKWKPSRLLRLEEEGISALTERDGYIAVADTAGNVTFFNEELQKVKWTQNFSAGKILSISFHVEYESFGKAGADTVLGDFLIGCSGPTCGLVSYSAGTLHTVMESRGAPWTHGDTSPTKNIIILVNIFGVLVTFNYLTNQKVAEKELGIEDEVTCIKFSVCGALLAVGTKKGNLWLLKEESLEPVRSIPFSYSKGTIKSCLFSPCGTFLSTLDTDRCLSVYKQNKLLGQWELLGRYRAHCRAPLQMMYGQHPDTQARILLTLGKDMKMNQFDLETSTISQGLVLTQRSLVEQRCQPTCMAWLPPSTSQETFLVLANKHHKQRMINLTTKMCRKVVSGPHNTNKHISNMLFVPGVLTSNPMKTTDGYFLISSGNFIVLQKLPLTGAPRKL